MEGCSYDASMGREERCSYDASMGRGKGGKRTVKFGFIHQYIRFSLQRLFQV